MILRTNRYVRAAWIAVVLLGLAGLLALAVPKAWERLPGIGGPDARHAFPGRLERRGQDSEGVPADGGGRPEGPREIPGAAVFEGSTLEVASPDGSARWVMSIERAEISEKDKVGAAFGVEARYLESDAETVVIRAGQVRIDWGASTVVFSGGVSGRSSHGHRFSAASVRWSGKENLLRAEGGVEWSGGGMTARAQSFSADPGLTRVRLSGGAELTAAKGRDLAAAGDGGDVR